jgi:tetratricopeptide (TPR) repeat protein
MVALEDQVAALRGLGEVRRRQLRYSEAAEYFRRALQIDSTDSAARLGLAQALRGQNNYPQAQVEVQRVLDTDATNLNARVLRAQLLGDAGQEVEAQRELDALIASMPENPPLESWLVLATAFSELRNYENALELLATARRQYPAEATVPRRIAETLTAARRWDEAITQYDALLAADPRDADAVLGQARVYNYSNRLEQSETLYRRSLQLEPDNYQALVELADVLSRRDNWPEAITLYRQAIERNPADLRPRLELARTLRYNRGYSDAEAILTQIIAFDPTLLRPIPSAAFCAASRPTTHRPSPICAVPCKLRRMTSPRSLAWLRCLVIQAITRNQSGFTVPRCNANQRMRKPASSWRWCSLTHATIARRWPKPNSVSGGEPAEHQCSDRARRYSVAFRRLPGFHCRLPDRADATSRRTAARGLAWPKHTPTAASTTTRLRPTINSSPADPDNVSFRVARGRTLGYAQRYSDAVNALQAVLQTNPGNTQARLALAEVQTNSGNRALRAAAVGHYQTVLRENRPTSRRDWGWAVSILIRATTVRRVRSSMSCCEHSPTTKKHCLAWPIRSALQASRLKRAAFIDEYSMATRTASARSKA